jgi:hypothetical protein
VVLDNKAEGDQWRIVLDGESEGGGSKSLGEHEAVQWVL